MFWNWNRDSNGEDLNKCLESANTFECEGCITQMLKKLLHFMRYEKA